MKTFCLKKTASLSWTWIDKGLCIVLESSIMRSFVGIVRRDQHQRCLICLETLTLCLIHGRHFRVRSCRLNETMTPGAAVYWSVTMKGGCNHRDELWR